MPPARAETLFSINLNSYSPNQAYAMTRETGYEYESCVKTTEPRHRESDIVILVKSFSCRKACKCQLHSFTLRNPKQKKMISR